MSAPGELLHRQRDEYGLIQVHQDHNLRYLSFGNDVLQSVVDVTRPASPVFLYTRAMLLALALQPDPRRVLLLGLGAGALVQALLKASPGSRLLAVELRAAVVELARRWFFLPEDRRLGVRIDDAEHYVRDTSGECDLLFTDLYHAEGMQECQARADYLAACRSRLAPGGLLVCNYWMASPLTALALNEGLQEVFEDSLLTLQVAGGNTLVFAFDAGIPRVDKDVLTGRAERLGELVDIPLTRLARDLWRQNAVAFRRPVQR